MREVHFDCEWTEGLWTEGDLRLRSEKYISIVSGSEGVFRLEATAAQEPAIRIL